MEDIDLVIHLTIASQTSKNPGKALQALLNLDVFAVQFSTVSYEYCNY